MSKRKTIQSNSNKQKLAKIDASASNFEAAQEAFINLKSTIGKEIKDATTSINKQKDDKIQELRDKHALIKANNVTDLAESTSAITAKYKDALSTAASAVAVAKDNYYKSCTGCLTSCDPKELFSCPKNCTTDLKCSSCRKKWPSCGNHCSSCQPDRDVVENAPKTGVKQKQKSKKKSTKKKPTVIVRNILKSTFVHHVERSIVAVTHALRKILRFNLALVGNTIVTSIFVLNAIRPLHLDVVVNFAVTVKEV